MRRWLFVLLLLVLPFQMVWASAAPYCAHESNGAAAKHFGHHEHKHSAGGVIKPAADDNDGSGFDHPDCGSCHLGCSPPFSAYAPDMGSESHGAALGTSVARFSSHIPAGPDRPNRVDLTAAARFGGGVALDLQIA